MNPCEISLEAAWEYDYPALYKIAEAFLKNKAMDKQNITRF